MGYKWRIGKIKTANFSCGRQSRRAVEIIMVKDLAKKHHSIRLEGNDNLEKALTESGADEF